MNRISQLIDHFYVVAECVAPSSPLKNAPDPPRSRRKPNWRHKRAMTIFSTGGRDRGKGNGGERYRSVTSFFSPLLSTYPLNRLRKVRPSAPSPLWWNPNIVESLWNVKFTYILPVNAISKRANDSWHNKNTNKITIICHCVFICDSLRQNYISRSLYANVTMNACARRIVNQFWFEVCLTRLDKKNILSRTRDFIAKTVSLTIVFFRIRLLRAIKNRRFCVKEIFGQGFATIDFFVHDVSKRTSEERRTTIS